MLDKPAKLTDSVHMEEIQQRKVQKEEKLLRLNYGQTSSRSPLKQTGARPRRNLSSPTVQTRSSPPSKPQLAHGPTPSALAEPSARTLDSPRIPHGSISPTTLSRNSQLALGINPDSLRLSLGSRNSMLSLSPVKTRCPGLPPLGQFSLSATLVPSNCAPGSPGVGCNRSHPNRIYFSSVSPFDINRVDLFFFRAARAKCVSVLVQKPSP
ncbi:hypothetical protein CRG98_006395 [Punica granatum]|uniref:Uncharacterized protein n=1 Tax=Punica granatum TaxID=22663 RepID=A0A2I0KXK8_PUNGR|nr:hypothetical protein CRG98_006395 [Punica granatum]